MNTTLSEIPQWKISVLQNLKNLIRWLYGYYFFTDYDWFLWTIEFSLPYFETSACTSTNVEKAVECLLDLVMQRIQQSVEHIGMPLRDSDRISLGKDSSLSPNAYCSYC